MDWEDISITVEFDEGITAAAMEFAEMAVDKGIMTVDEACEFIAEEMIRGVRIS